MAKPRMKFLGRVNHGHTLRWESVDPINERESRHEQIVADVEWFYGMMLKEKKDAKVAEEV